MQVGKSVGMVSLNDALMDLVTKKLVAPEEAYSKSVDKTGFEALLKRAGIDEVRDGSRKGANDGGLTVSREADRWLTADHSGTDACAFPRHLRSRRTSRRPSALMRHCGARAGREVSDTRLKQESRAELELHARSPMPEQRIRSAA